MNCDTNGDDKCDLNCDTNGDGKCDLNCDNNGDGKCDLNCDTNGDGKCDSECDTNGDGKCDLNCSSIDEPGEYIITFLDKENMNYSSVRPGWTASKTFTIKNESKATLKYDIYWDEIINEFTKTNNLYFGLVRNGSTVIDISSNRTPYPNNGNKVLMLNNVILKPGETHSYELTLLFKDTGLNQDVDRGKIFSSRLQIVNKGI